MLQTDKADVHTDITANEITNLPILSSQGRSFQALYKLVPGSGLPTEANSPAGNPQRAISVNTNGQSLQTNNTRIDGALDAYPWLPQNVAYVPPADAIETVNITSNSFDAEQGNAGGTAVNVIIKSGTNSFHGTAHEFHTDNAFAAKDYFQPTTKTVAGVVVHNPTPRNVQNQFGGTIGGPIKKDKLFFFGDYERTLQRQLASSNQTVFGGTDPSAADFYQKVRAGDFSGLPTDLYDPATGNANGSGRSRISCGGVLNVICPDRLDSAAVAFLRRLPAPNVARGVGGTNNYFALLPSTYTRDTFDIKVNYIPTSKMTTFARYSMSRSVIFDPPVFSDPANITDPDFGAGGGAIGGGSVGNANGRIQSIGLGATYTISPTMVADWNLGFTRQRLNAYNFDLSQNIGLDEFGIPGTNGPSPLEGGLPFFSFTTYSNMGNGDTGNPFLFRDNQWVTNGNLSWTKGKHSLRFGMEMDRAGINHFQPQSGSFGTARGSLLFGGQPTLNGTGNPDLWNSLASFLLGYPSQIGKATQTTNPVSLRWTTWAFYARDQFQITPKLTLSYGVRWEYYPFAHSVNGRGVSYFDTRPDSPNFNKVVIGGINGIPQDDDVDVGAGRFLPRIGIAYRLREKTVIRAGFGQSSDPNNWRFFRNNYPNIIATQINGSTGYPGFTGTSTTYVPAACMTGNQSTMVCSHPLPAYPGLQVGVPSVVAPDIASNAVITLPNSLGISGTVANPFHRGYINSYNLTIQNEIAGFVIETGYVGARAVRPLALLQYNVGTIGGGQNSAIYNIATNQLTTSPCATAINTPANPFARCPNTPGIGIYTPFKSNYYNSLQNKVTRRFRDGSMIGVVYTWQRAISYSDDEELQSTLFTLPSAYDKNKGPARFDRTHNFQLFGLYQLPFGKGKSFAQSGIASVLAGGWEINWTFSHLSGTPFTVTANNNMSAPGSGTNAADQVAPVRYLDGVPASSCSADSCRFFDVTAFATPPTTRYGTANRNSLRGPGFTNLDLSVSRRFRLSERFGLQLRADAFGITNTPHFANPNANVNGANFGAITSTIGGRSGTNLNGARLIWLSGKLTF